MQASEASLTVVPTTHPITKPGSHECKFHNLGDCYPAVEADLTAVFDGDQYEQVQGVAGTILAKNILSSISYSFSKLDSALNYSTADRVRTYTNCHNMPVCVAGHTLPSGYDCCESLGSQQDLPWINPVPTLSTTIEYSIENTKRCNASVAAQTRFSRHDLDADGYLDSDEFSKMLYEIDFNMSGTPGTLLSTDAGERLDVIKGVVDTDDDGLLSYVELLTVDERREAFHRAPVRSVAESAGWEVTAAELEGVTSSGGGLRAALEPAADILTVTREEVGHCLAATPGNDFVQKECLIQEMFGLPAIEPTQGVRCVRKTSVDMFLSPITEYHCVPYEQCGTRPDPAYTDGSQTIAYDCDFSSCTPDSLRYGDGSETGEIGTFRCWDSCRLAEIPSNDEGTSSHLKHRNDAMMKECEHIEQRPSHCRHGQPCFFVDTLDPTVTTEEQAEQKLMEISVSMAEYARSCRSYNSSGFVEECRWMRCHGIGYALGAACDNHVPPPCRSTCEAYVENTPDEILQEQAHSELGLCDDDADPRVCGCGDEIPRPRPNNPYYWSYMHCRALRHHNCTAFPDDSMAGLSWAEGGCMLPERYPGGVPCVRDGECTSQACPLEHGDDSPAVEGEGGVCCNEGLNGCSGHGVCTLHSDSTTPRSLGPAAAVPFGGCVCDKEWTGSDCSQWMMPAHIFLAWLAVVSFLIFGTLSWCAVWLRWWLAIHRVTPPPPPDSPTKPPKKPAREESTSSDDSDSDEDLGNYACRLVVYVCNCTGLPTVFKGKMDTYIKVILGERAKRVRTIRNGGEEPKWTAGTEPDAGEEVGWYTTRRLCSIKVEVWRDEQRFKGVEGHDSVDRLLCRTVVPVPEFIPPEQTGKGVESDLWNIDGQEAGKVKLRLLWRDPGEPKRPVELDPV